MLSGFLTAISLALAVAAGPSIPSEWVYLTVGNWTADGSAVTWYASLDPGGECAVLDFRVITDAEGKAFEIFSQNRMPIDTNGQPCEQMPRKAKDLWKRGMGEDGVAALKQWIKEHPIARSSKIEGGTEPREITGGKEPLKLSIVSGKERCPTLSVFAEWGSVSGSAAERPCSAEEQRKNMRYFTSTYHAIWSPDGTRLAVEWHVARFTDQRDISIYIKNDAAQSFGAGTIAYQPLVISRRSLASIDLLDAGTAARVDSLAGRLEKAGFRLAHRGKAKDPHAQTEIFYAPGFEPEAQEIARLAGAAEANLKPLSWKSPYAITVAIGAR